MRALDFAVSRILPEDMRRETYDLGKKGMAELMAEVARKHPDQFPDVTQKLGDLGRRAAWLQGYTTSAEDTRPVIDTKKYYAQMDAEIDALRKQKLPQDEFDEQRAEIYTKYSGLIEQATMKEAMKRRNAFALAVASGARGNPAHVQAILSTPGVYQDAKGKVIPLFVRNSFGDGVRPAETLAGTFGARHAVTSTKKATARGGDLLKIMTQAALNFNVTEKDCGVKNGLAMKPDADHMTGRVLAAPAGEDIPAGTVIDRQVVAQLRRRGKPVTVRSVMTCQAEHGICAKCAGVQADGKFPNVGKSLGVRSAQAIGEPIVQGSLNCLVEGTTVRMADFSTKRIEALRPGDMVLGADLEGNTFPVRVTDVWDQGLQPVQRRYFKMGQTSQLLSLDSTECHPILANTKTYGRKNGEKNNEAQLLHAGKPHKNLAAVLPKSIDVPGIDEPWALLLGVLLGDGNRWSDVGHQAITMSCVDLEEIKHLREVMKPLGVRIKKNLRSHDWRIVMAEEPDADRDSFGQFKPGLRSPAKRKLSHWGLQGKYAHEKRLPACVWKWSQESCAKVIAGFLATDGSVYRSKDGHVGISFASSSREMLSDLKELLALKLCVYSSSLTRTGKAGDGNRVHDMWQFTVTRLDQVQQLYGHIAAFIPGVKRRRLQDFLDNAAYQRRNADPFYRAKRVETEDLGVMQCWDISVEHADSLFVLENGLIVKNTKHNAGAAKGKKAFSGLDYISQFLQVPEEFKDRASVSELDGVVESVEEAPQGGTYITVNGEKHFVLPGFEPLVKVGQRVEAGDPLSDGLINPADIVRLRGLGEGRKYYAERLSQMLRDSGQNPDARNVEMIARAALDNYLVEDPPDEDSPWLPDDLVRESELLRNYRPAKDTQELPLQKAVGKYLQAPALHYTVGTRLTPRMVKDLQDSQVERVAVSGEKPWFRPEMKRMRVVSHDSDDWMVSLGTSYLGAQMRNALERGDETNVAENYHFGPRLAYGVDAGKGAFGENIERTGKF